MVKISSDLIDQDLLNWRTWRHVVLTTTLVELEKITSSRGPDQEQQRRQRVYRQLGVQQALVQFQIEMKT
jgi:hypothetical protein